MKNIIKTFKDCILRFFGNRKHWEEALGDWSDEWSDVTDPIIYLYEYEPPPLPDNVIFATERFERRKKE